MINTIRNTLLLLVINSVCCFGLTQSINSVESVDLRSGHYTERLTEIEVPGPLPFLISVAQNDEGHLFCKGWSLTIKAPQEGVLNLKKEFDEDERLTKAFVQGPSNEIYSSITLEYSLDQILLSLHDGRSFRYQLNSSNKLDEMKNPNGDVISFTYTGDQISEKKCSWGMHLVNEICPQTGRVLTQQAKIEREGPLKTLTTYTYSDNTVTVESPWGLKKIYTFFDDSITCSSYDKETLIKSELIGENQRKIFDSENKLLYSHTKECLPNGKISSETYAGEGESFTLNYTYNDDHLLTSKEDSEGNKSVFTYDSSNLLASDVYIDHLGNKTSHSFTYCDGILIEQVTEDDEKVLVKTIIPSSESHSKGLPQVIEESINGTIQKAELFEYTHSGLVTAYVLYDIAKASYSWSQSEYDAANRECFRSDSSGKTVATHFNDETGVVMEIDHSSGAISESHVNILGKTTKKLVRRVGEKELVQENTYDERGMLIHSTDTLGAQTDYTYDALGHLTEKTLPEVLNSQDQLIRYKISYKYDALGRVIESTDAEGDTIRATYRFHKRPIRLSYSDGTFDEMRYSPSGTLTYMLDRNGTESKPTSNITKAPSEETSEETSSTKPHTHYEVDKTSKTLKQTTEFQTGLQLISHIDSLGRVQSVDALNAQRVPLFHKELRYDGNGLMTKEVISSYLDGSLESTRETHWKYGACGRLLKKIEEGKVTSYSYNDLGVQEVVTRPDGISLYYIYDNDGSLQSLKSSDGSVHYSFNNVNGRLIQAFDHVNNTSFTRSYNEDGKLLSEELESGLALSHTYNCDGKRIETDFSDGSKVFFDEHTLTRLGCDGSLLYTLKKESDGTQTLPGNVGTVQFTKGEIKAPQFSQKFLYSGDQLSGVKEEKKNLPLTYDCLGQLTADGTETFSYSGTGEVQRSPSTEFNYSFDALDRLTKAANDSVEIIYTYDALNRRSTRKVTSLKNGKVLDEERYLYDGKKEIGATKDGQKLDTLRIESTDFKGHFVLENQEGIFSCVKDLRGSVRMLYDIETGDVVESYDYTSFGECSQGKGISPWRFAGRRSDDLTGLVDFGRRDFDPKGARFISKDPAGSFDSISPYVFAQNDPWGKTDLGGLFSVSSTFQSLTNWCKNYNPIDNMRTQIMGFGNQLQGVRYLKLWFGWNEELSHTGLFGNGELHDRYRITFINGILTNKSTLIDNADLISQSHGGCNVHYCYVSTHGWAADLVRAVASKFGVTSSEAKTLAATWKKLIQELGGPENGGIIFHYAHSLGGTETLRASYLLTPEERRMIAIITMGSPTLIPDDGTFHSVINIVSCRDIISVFSPKEFFYSILLGDKSVVFVGSHFDGWPVIDHLFAGYWQHFKDNIWEEFEYLFK